jgi:peroxiredoxin/mono/diheme cytochrome c family protein
MRTAWPIALVLPLILILPVPAAAQSPSSADEAAKSLVGRQIAEFALKDFRGKEHKLADFADKKLLVVAFLGTECPLAKLYGPRLQKMADELADQGVAFVGINSNRQDSITELEAHVRRHGIKFPILKDLGNRVADAFGATRTPEIFVLDENRVVRYHGRVDSQYTFDFGVGYVAPELERSDLGAALGELLAGKDVSVPETELKGCIIGRVRESKENTEVTYSNQIARIMQTRCQECHREGQIAPFALMNYDEVAGWGEMIGEVVRQQRMPPWHADPKFGHFSNALRLSDEEKQQVYSWVDNGCPEGDPADLPEPRKFAGGWFLPQEPDLVIKMGDEPFEIPAEGVVDYQYFVVDPGFTEDKWVKMAECMPGNRQVVHHIVVFLQLPKEDRETLRKARASGIDFRSLSLLEGYAPGTRPMIYPKGMAKRIPAGSKLVFNLHYTPNGSPQTDISSIGLVFADKDEVITHVAATTNTGTVDFEIPPNAPNYRIVARKKMAQDTLLLSLYPHMHLRGKSMKYEVNYPDGRHEVLIDVPRYDFNWQIYYVLAEPKLLPKDTEMVVTAYYDNSADNLSNPDPSKAVVYGPQTWDEMMYGWYSAAFPVEALGLDPSGHKAKANPEAAGD